MRALIVWFLIGSPVLALLAFGGDAFAKAIVFAVLLAVTWGLVKGLYHVTHRAKDLARRGAREAAIAASPERRPGYRFEDVGRQ